MIAPQWQLERMGVDSSAMLSGSASLWVLRERESCVPAMWNRLLLGQELKPQVLTIVLPNVARLYDS